MSATLEYAATHPMIKVDFPLTNYTPATTEEIREFKELSRELANIPPSHFADKKTIAPHKKVSKKTLSIDAERMF